MGDIFRDLLTPIINNEIFLVRHTHNSFTDISKMFYNDFVVLTEVIFNEMKAENENHE